MNLITGGTGFLGAHLAALLLKQDRNVKIFKRPSSSFDELHLIFRYHFGVYASSYFKRLSFVDGDITDIDDVAQALNDISYVFHCAATVSFDKKKQKMMNEINVTGTKNLVNAMLEMQCSAKLCHVSSIASLGRSSNNSMIDESTMWDHASQNTNYSKTKYYSEIEVWRGIAEGLNAVIVQPGIILGPGQWNKGSCELVPLVDRGLKFFTRGVNGFVDVEDVVEVMIKLMYSDISEQRFILVSENLSYQDLFTKIAHNLDRKPPSIHAGYTLRKLVVRADALRSVLFRKKRTYSDEFALLAGSRSEYDPSKIMTLLNHRFIAIDLCLEKTCRFYKQNQSI